MSGWKEIRVGGVLLIHHSTSSVVQVIIDGDDNQSTQVIWLDYYSLGELKEAIAKTED